MLDKTKPVQGYVVYGEFRRGGTTHQVFFTPDGFNSIDNYVPFKVHRRTISAGAPKKQWKTSSAPDADIRTAIAEGVSFTPTREWAESRLHFCSVLFDQMLAQGWEMIGTPLIVEASKRDMDDLGSYKTPAKIIYRINQSRDAAGFPADLYAR